MTVAQRGPVWVEGQAQEKVPGLLLQVPPFWQGLVGRHSLISVEQEASVKPARQVQVPVPGLPGVLAQEAPLRQGLVAQKSTRVWHCLPPQPGRQVHLKELAWPEGISAATQEASAGHSTQLTPLEPQGPEGHQRKPASGWSHRVPDQVVSQAQEKVPGKLVQLPWRHGLEPKAHSSRSWSQRPRGSQPRGQLQELRVGEESSGLSAQTPPFRQFWPARARRAQPSMTRQVGPE